MKPTLLTSTAALLALTLARCGSDNAAPTDNGEAAGNTDDAAVGSGGSTGTGGKTGAGGSSATGGKPGAGGSPSTGGSTGTGGTVIRPDGGTPASCPADAGTPQPAGTPPTLTPGQWTNISPPGLARPRAAAPPFGCMDIQVSPCNPYVVYLTTDIEGMWRSKDGGSTWTEIGNLPTPISPGVIQIDPRNPSNMYYIGGVRGSSAGFWVSTDGGDTWASPAGFTDKANNSVDGWTNDAYDVKADPADFKHVVVTFHSGFEWTGNAGVLETTDGGDTWIRHWPSGWGAGHSVWFLGDSSTWLVGTQYNGYWRTADAGTTWKQVSTTNMQHGGTGAFVSKTGVLYVGALSNILRSTDNGLTFTAVAPHTGDGYYAIVGDGNKLYTQLGNTGGNGTGVDQPYLTSDEADGVTWTDYNAQKFADGPYRMAFDKVNRIIYSANWNAGVWALKVTP
jgi:photosystem II stability/assembly factor-like uncharacterized protein